jgi:hypothetical protein
MTDVTQLLSALEQGDPHAASRLLPPVYDELSKLAAQPFLSIWVSALEMRKLSCIDFKELHLELRVAIGCRDRGLVQRST